MSREEYDRLIGKVSGSSYEDYISVMVPFHQKSAFLAPGVLGRIRNVLKKLKVTPEAVKVLFQERAATIKESMKLPVSIEEAWEKKSRRPFLRSLLMVALV